MFLPSVTVICICYNQARFVEEAIFSVLAQTYPNIQLIVVDDASTDNSVAIIQACLSSNPQIEFIPLSKNSGNCKAFNRAFRLAKGEYIIDLAADDVLLPERVIRGVTALGRDGEAYDVNFTDADWMAEDGKPLYRHSDRFPHKTIPDGNIYKDLIERFFICSPTMMFSRKVIETLGGYDESLAYEDFDFWIRSSRTFYYRYTAEVLVKKRIVKNSMSQRQFRLFNPQLRSTFRVCEKIMALNKSNDEKKALSKRILYEMRVCMSLLNIPLAMRYLKLYLKNSTRYYRDS
jgi:glycosyltransferase involved in cell wall biosynthesis